MSVQWMKILLKDRAVADLFFNWCKQNKLDPNVIFLMTDYVLLLGVILQFLYDKYDIIMHVDCSGYMVIYAHNENLKNHVLTHVTRFEKTLLIHEKWRQEDEPIRDVSFYYTQAIDETLNLLVGLPF